MDDPVKYICHYCREETTNPTRDHIYPKSKIRKHREKAEPLPDGVELQNNTVVSCAECNTIKGAKDYDSFVQLGVTAIRHLKKMFINKRISKRFRHKHRYPRK